MSDFEERTKENNRIRQRAYYNANKEKILQKRKERRAEIQKVLKESKKQDVAIVEVVSPAPAPATTTTLTTTTPVKLMKGKKQLVKNLQPLQLKATEEQVRKAMQETNYYKEESTKKTNLQQIPLIFRAIKNEPLTEWIKKPEELIKAVKDLKQISKKSQGQDYALSGIPRILGAVLATVKFMNLNITTEQDKVLFDGYRIAKLNYDLTKFKEKHPVLNTDTAVKDYDSILKDVKKKKGEDSLVYLVARLYNDCPLRDNYSNITLIKDKNDMKQNNNYIVLPQDGVASVYIQNHKTLRTSGIIEASLSTQTTNLLRKYVKKHKIKYDEHLFGNLKNILKDIIPSSAEDKQDGGTRSIRRSLASSLYNNYTKGKATIEDVYKQIKMMAHSSDTHMKDYIYAIRKIG